VGDAEIEVKLRGLGDLKIETLDFRVPPGVAVSAEVVAETMVEVRPRVWMPTTCRLEISGGNFRVFVFPRKPGIFGNFQAQTNLKLHSSGIFDEAVFIRKASETVSDANVVGLLWRSLGLRLAWADDRRTLEMRGTVDAVSQALSELIRVVGDNGEFAAIDVEFKVGEVSCYASTVAI
jgi:hypothetical protein